jgi:hypothetical protein
VVEGTPLLREHAVKNCIEGSNPSVSANSNDRLHVGFVHEISVIVVSAALMRYNYFVAPVAQLDRVLGYEPRGRGFESCRARQFYQGLTEM